ncbi:MAG TPA: PIN domain nuclease [Solirubrobacteraceae bacterium]|nr:PIN domain nuclease [Solirubrobacteraceae bacterium]
MILIDTSAWVEFLRGTGSPVCDRVDALLGGEFATCHPIRMELLAGARDDRHLGQLRGLLARAVLLPTPPAHYEAAAALYRACRRQGATVRKLIDCLIAAHAIDVGAALLHADSDFSALARCTALRLDSIRPGEAGTNSEV